MPGEAGVDECGGCKRSMSRAQRNARTRFRHLANGEGTMNEWSDVAQQIGGGGSEHISMFS